MLKNFDDVDQNLVNSKEEVNDTTVPVVSALTPHQETIKTQIILSMLDGNKKIILSGSAGVGKTFLVQHLITEFRRKVESYGTILITAPTNRAVSVLAEKQPNAPYYIEFKTIHKALYLKRKINDKTGEVSFVPDYNPSRERPLKGVSLLVVDEASMLNSELLFYLEDQQYKDTYMVFLGDNKQLNPVQELNSPIFIRPQIRGQRIEIKVAATKEVLFHNVPSYQEFELTQIIRQAANNPIITLSRNLQNIGLLDNNLNEEGKGYSYITDYEQVLNMIIKEGENIRYLAWTNDEVNKTNNIVRKRLFGNPNKVELGETIIFHEPYEGITTGNLYYTNYELQITDLKVKSHPFTAVRNFRLDDGVQKDLITIESEIDYYLINDDVRIIHEHSMFKFLDMFKQLKFLVKYGLSWKVIYGFTEQFAKFSYRYALTVHKSQGGTFKYVIINMKDLNKNRNSAEHKRLWYTAITRASHNVFMYNPPFYQTVNEKKGSI